MKAALVSQYNKNNINLEMTEIPIPQIGPDDVLIKARAAGVNPLDNMISRGEVRIIVPCDGIPSRRPCFCPTAT